MTRTERDEIMGNLQELVTDLYGERCPEFGAACMTCIAWSIFDVVDRLTDGSLLA